MNLYVCGYESVSSVTHIYWDLSITSSSSDILLASSTDMQESDLGSWFISDVGISHIDCFTNRTYYLCSSISETEDSCLEEWTDTNKVYLTGINDIYVSGDAMGI